MFLVRLGAAQMKMLSGAAITNSYSGADLGSLKAFCSSVIRPLGLFNPQAHYPPSLVKRMHTLLLACVAFIELQYFSLKSEI